MPQPNWSFLYPIPVSHPITDTVFGKPRVPWYRRSKSWSRALVVRLGFAINPMVPKRTMPFYGSPCHWCCRRQRTNHRPSRLSKGASSSDRAVGETKLTLFFGTLLPTGDRPASRARLPGDSKSISAHLPLVFLLGSITYSIPILTEERDDRDDIARVKSLLPIDPLGFFDPFHLVLHYPTPNTRK